MQKFISLGVRIRMSFFVLIVAILIMSWVSFASLHSMGERVSTLNDAVLPSIQVSSSIDSTLGTIRQIELNILIHQMNGNKSEISNLLNQMQLFRKKYAEIDAVYEELPYSSEKYSQREDADAEEFRHLIGKYLSGNDMVISLLNSYINQNIEPEGLYDIVMVKQWELLKPAASKMA
ncbi:TPA: MCP four helix bundle domain-containing protein, partial [Aeromonas veronii]